MTTVSDAVTAADAAAEANGRPVGESNVRAVPPGTRARTSVTQSQTAVGGLRSDALGRLRSVPAVVKADLAGAWGFRVSPPTLADLWNARKPPIERVPGENKALWLVWLVTNHLVLPLVALLGVGMWVLQHPVRIVLAVLILVPLITMLTI